MTTAGLRALQVADPATGTGVPVWVFHPALAAERPVPLGRYAVSAAPDAPGAPGAHPLVVVSHGSGSTPFLHRELAAHLARRGFVVAALAHPGSTRDDDSLAGTAENLRARPRHVRAVIDHLTTHAGLPVRSGPVAVVGHSLGGCTALSLAGGRPTAFGAETPDGVPAPVPVDPDDRVGALVLLNPATPWFSGAGALSAVRVPILMVTGRQDRQAPGFMAQRVLDGVADRALVEHRDVPDAGHFSFLSPFPPELVGAALPPSLDPPGFDRAAFHRVLLEDVTRFLDAHLRR